MGLGQHLCDLQLTKVDGKLVIKKFITVIITWFISSSPPFGRDKKPQHPLVVLTETITSNKVIYLVLEYRNTEITVNKHTTPFVLYLYFRKTLTNVLKKLWSLG